MTAQIRKGQGFFSLYDTVKVNPMKLSAMCFLTLVTVKQMN